MWGQEKRQNHESHNAALLWLNPNKVMLKKKQSCIVTSELMYLLLLHSVLVL